MAFASGVRTTKKGMGVQALQRLALRLVVSGLLAANRVFQAWFQDRWLEVRVWVLLAPQQQQWRACLWVGVVWLALRHS